MMAVINTKNVHRSNLLMGHPYGRDFVYDEMIVVGPGGARRLHRLDSLPGGGPKPGEGPTKEEREAGFFDVLFIGIATDGRKVRVSVKGDGPRLRLDVQDAGRDRDLPGSRARRARRRLDPRRGAAGPAGGAAAAARGAEVRGRRVTRPVYVGPDASRGRRSEELMPQDHGLELRSLARADGTLELSLAEVPIPEPGPDEVLVRVEASRSIPGTSAS